MVKNKILIIEDDISLGKGIALALSTENTDINVCKTLLEAREMLVSKDYNIIILDINLPDGNGLDFLIEIKKDYEVPVIILTANDLETDIVTGLELGADDYITKPFSLAVLRARVNTQLRKVKKDNRNIIFIDDLYFDFENMNFKKNNNEIMLSKTEQKLLKYFVNNRGVTLRRSDLVDKIWSEGSEYVDENALSVTVKRLRDKLEDNPSKPKYLKTVYGIGYVWEK